MSNFDLYQIVTDRVLELMTKHGANWVNPFNKRGDAYAARNPITDKAYRGINQLLLGTTAHAAPFYAGFGQWKDKGCVVRKGEKATMIVYWKMLERETVGADGTAKKSQRPLLRYLNVFNVCQVDGAYAAQLMEARAAQPAITDETKTIASVDEFFARTGAVIRHSDKAAAFYSPAADFVHMPFRRLFTATATATATENYYSTLAHELTHWTGHSTRLARNFASRFGDQAYAFEELVAEMGAAMLCAQLGVSTTPRPDHAQYLNHWISVLQADSGAIIKAATLAKHAAARLSFESTESAEVAA